MSPYPSEKREAAVALACKLNSLEGAAREIGVSPTTIRTWLISAGYSVIKPFKKVEQGKPVASNESKPAVVEAQVGNSDTLNTVLHALEKIKKENRYLKQLVMTLLEHSL